MRLLLMLPILLRYPIGSLSSQWRDSAFCVLLHVLSLLFSSSARAWRDGYWIQIFTENAKCCCSHEMSLHNNREEAACCMPKICHGTYPTQRFKHINSRLTNPNVTIRMMRTIQATISFSPILLEYLELSSLISILAAFQSLQAASHDISKKY